MMGDMAAVNSAAATAMFKRVLRRERWCEDFKMTSVRNVLFRVRLIGKQWVGQAHCPKDNIVAQKCQPLLTLICYIFRKK